LQKLFRRLLVILIVVLLGWFLFGGNTPDSFHLKFSGMSDLGVQQIIVTEGNKQHIFAVDSSNWDIISDYDIEVLSGSLFGAVELDLLLANGKMLRLQKMEYKVGKANYVTEYEGRLKYVKAHWQ